MEPRSVKNMCHSPECCSWTLDRQGANSILLPVLQLFVGVEGSELGHQDAKNIEEEREVHLRDKPSH